MQQQQNPMLGHALLQLQGDLADVMRNIASGYAPKNPTETVPDWMRRAGEELTAKHGKDVVIALDWSTKKANITSLVVIKRTIDEYMRKVRNVPVATDHIEIRLGHGMPVVYPYGALRTLLEDVEKMVDDTKKDHAGHMVVRVLTACADKKTYTARTAWL
jgi:hypothetical protein